MIKQTLFSLSLIMLLPLVQLVQAQDPHFSQFNNVGVYLNPAVTCLDNDVQATMAMRKQWQNINRGITNYYASIESKVRNKKLYFSFLVFNETIQDFNSNSRAELIYTWRAIDATKIKLQFGLTLFSLNQRNLDYNKLLFSDQLDPVYGNIKQTGAVFDKNQNFYYPDWNTGVVLKGKEKNYGHFMIPTVGISLQHLLGNKIKPELKRKFIAFTEFHLRYPIRSSNADNRKYLDIKPSGIFETQASFKTISFGSAFEAYNFSFGFWFRTWDMEKDALNAIILSLGINVPITDDALLKVTYSYDATTSDLEFSSGGTHEINLRYMLDYTLKCRSKVSRKEMKKFR
jgi:type IX secretion system PorP/SprF family membrane protein